MMVMFDQRDDDQKWNYSPLEMAVSFMYIVFMLYLTQIHNQIEKMGLAR